MTEIVLPYDRSVVPQEKSWDCGPASTQVVLNSRGIIATEDQLISEIGTTVNGTDYVGLIERVLDVRIPDARYTSVYIDHDPATNAEKETLWDNLTRSIRAGYGVVMNWVAPPGNHPIGVKGSASPNYGSGTIWHYVPCMGFDDTPGARAVWIADPGFQPFGYWISFDQCATLIPPKGYAYADIGAPAAAPVNDAADVLMQVMGGSVNFDRYQALAPEFGAALTEIDCTTVDRIALFAAELGEESGGLRWQEEIASGAEYENRCSDLGNCSPGDGVRYKGRDFIQVTGKSNYTRLSQWAFGRGLVPSSTFFVDNPAALATDTYAFLGAIWFWTAHNLNDYADRGDIVGASEVINGGDHGLDDRIARWNRARAMGNQLLTLIQNGDDMATVPQDQWTRALFLLEQIAGVYRPSMSLLSHVGEGNVNTCAGFSQTGDGLTHPQFLEFATKYGHVESYELLLENAGADLTAHPEKAASAQVAINMLADLKAANPARYTAALAQIEQTKPTVLQQFINAQKGK